MRLRQGLVLLGGATAFLLVVGSDPAAFYLTPLGIGLVYLLAAAAGGRQGGYWAGALVFCGWGAAVVVVRQARPDLDIAGLYLAGAGLGAVLAIAIQRAGVRSDPMGAAAAIVAAGTILALSDTWAPLTESRTYALLVGAIGLLNVVWALLAQRSSDQPAASAERSPPRAQ